MPRKTASASMRSSPLTMTARTQPAASSSISVTCAPKRTSPPSPMICWRMLRTMGRSLSVPICGFCRYRISSGAPAATNVSNTSRIWGSELRDVSLPSENVPAPPSPNCTFVRISSSPVCQKCSTAAWRASTSSPRSSTSGCQPALASCRAASMPAGPNPTTIGRRSSGRCSLMMAGAFSGSTLAADTLLSRRQRRSTVCSDSFPCRRSCTIYTKCMGAPR